jgi:meso-butanediol dehydrogenase / (S,S)-butanediol dehydrogenase / diacetyl reductase
MNDTAATVADPMFRGTLSGRVAAVTGAGRGIGLGIATGFAEAGASVVLMDLDEAVVEAGENLAAAGVPAVGVVTDVTDPEQVRAALAIAKERFGGLDILVNNAGIITIDRLEDTTVESVEQVLKVNTTAVFIGVQEALPMLRESEHGCILNASSGQGRQGFLFTPAYAASKFGVIGMTQSMAKELAADGIRANAYCPGIVETPMWEYNDARWGRLLGGYEPGELIQEWIDGIPLKRPATASDVTNLLLFLASDAGQYITGQAINVDGGMFMS